MDKLEMVIKGLECHARGDCVDCPYREGWHTCKLGIDEGLFADVVAILKTLRPRLLTHKDFKNPSMADDHNAISAWIEYRRDDEEWADYWDDTPDEWSLVYEWNFESDSYRCWTSIPSKEQMEATPW